MTQIETETNIPGQKNDLNFYIWHPTLVRPARKRLFCLKAKNGIVIISLYSTIMRTWVRTSTYSHKTYDVTAPLLIISLIYSTIMRTWIRTSTSSHNTYDGTAPLLIDSIGHKPDTNRDQVRGHSCHHKTLLGLWHPHPTQT